MKGFIFGLVGVGVVIAVVIGLTGNSQSRAEKQSSAPTVDVEHVHA